MNINQFFAKKFPEPVESLVKFELLVDPGFAALDRLELDDTARLGRVIKEGAFAAELCLLTKLAWISSFGWLLNATFSLLGGGTAVLEMAAGIVSMTGCLVFRARVNTWLEGVTLSERDTITLDGEGAAMGKGLLLVVVGVFSGRAVLSNVGAGISMADGGAGGPGSSPNFVHTLWDSRKFVQTSPTPGTWTSNSRTRAVTVVAIETGVICSKWSKEAHVAVLMTTFSDGKSNLNDNVGKENVKAIMNTSLVDTMTRTERIAQIRKAIIVRNS
jgi:hypothetical protein